MTRLFLLLVLLVVLEVYTFSAVRAISKSKFVHILYWFFTIIAYGYVFYEFFMAQNNSRFSKQTGYAMAVFFTVLVPKLVVFITLFTEDIFRAIVTAYNYFQDNSSVKEAIPSRRKFVSQVALGIAAIPFTGFIYGVFKGRYNFRVIKQQITFTDLPEAFDGYTITQISDIHSGSLEDKNKIAYAVNLINEQKSDAIVFTGDLVNAIADEMVPWIEIFKKLHAKDGKFSILGNHDYGYYAYGDDADKIKKNHKKLEQIHKKIGFDLLQNENRIIKRNGESIHIVGVENWGASRHFPKFGSLEKATQNIPQNAFSVLLSHDPSHFDYQEREVNPTDYNNPKVVINETNIVDFRKNMQLTLSGHTHGMQFGIEIPFLNIKWSPVKYRYPKWAGLYQEAGKYLYVNRGFGVLAFPGRVGIWPEITVIELKREIKSA